MKISRVLIFLISYCFILSSTNAFAVDRPIIVIKSNATGVLKISMTELIPLYPEYENKNPRQLHLFKNGIEIPFLIADTSLAISAQNALYFYAEKNDGFLDKQLYDKVGAALNPYFSMYSDTSVYILYLDESSVGKYYQYQANTISNNRKEEIDVEQLLVFADQYHYGKDLGEGARHSEYTIGEGYSGALWSIGATQNRAFTLPTLASPSMVSIETYVSGQSNAIAADPVNNHHIRISLIGNGNTLIIDTAYKGYSSIHKTFNLNNNLFLSNNSLSYASVNDLGAQSDFNTVPYIKLNYTQKTSLGQGKFIRFKLKNNNTENLYFNDVQQDSILLFNIDKHKYHSPTLSNDSIYYSIGSFSGNQNFVLASVKAADLVRSYTVSASSIFTFDFTNEENELIILSAKSLENAATQYKQYKDAKGIPTYVVYVDDLYNAYSYGYHHPIAIKKFVDDYILHAKTAAKNLFIIGKGVQNNLYNNIAFAKRDLVPSIGNPPSDILYVSSLDFSILIPRMGIGRVSVENNEEALNYLDKIKDNDANMDDGIWRKNIIHATGGRSIAENNQFTAALEYCEAIAVQPYMGAKIFKFNKKVNEPVSDNYRERIIALTNQGISLLSYYGHGANYFVEINFGEPEALNNKGKYPVYLLSGCSVGNAANDNSLGENYINAKGKGAIGWLASTDLGFTSYLTEYNRQFYLNAFKESYGKTIGEIQKETIRDFVQANDSINILHTRQLVYQGDPTHHFYSPTLADFSTVADGLYLTATTFEKNDSVELALIIQNTGKSISDSISYRVERQVNNTNLSYPIVKHKAIFNTDTIYIRLERTKAFSGTNKIKINIDPEQKVAELNEMNNTIEKEFYFSSYSPIIIQPLNSSVLKNNKLKLAIQCSDLYAKNVEYNVEIDTTKTFNSSFKKTYKWIEQQLLIKEINLANLVQNSSVFVRVQIKGQNEISDWVLHEITYLPNNNAKWIQNKSTSLNTAMFNNIKTENNNIAFIDNNVEFAINTRGDLARTDSVERRLRLNNNPPVYLGSGITGICLIALAPKSLKRHSYASSYNLLANTPDYPFDVYKYSGVYVFNTNNATDIDSLLFYLNSLPAGYVVGGYNGLNSNFALLPENVLQAFEQLGLSKIRTIVNGEPYAFVGYKGAAMGTATEKIAENGIGLDPQKQFIRLNFAHKGTWDKGSISSEIIGPASKWKSVNWNFISDGSDEFKMSVLGIDTNGLKVKLWESVLAADSLNIGNINAKRYPYLQLHTEFADSVNFSPAKFKFWSTSYAPPIELSTFPQYQYLLHPTKTQQGDTVKYNIAFINVGEVIVDTSIINLFAINTDRTSSILRRDTLLNIGVGDTILQKYTIDTRNLFSEIKLRSSISAKNQLEWIRFNNEFESTFKIEKDLKSPLLKVTFDGKIPMQNDLISPRPLININLKDENPFLLLNDSAYINIELKKPSSSSYQKIAYQNTNLSYSPANNGINNEMNILYKPFFSEDGKYSLRVKVKDASNNTYGTNAYNIDFEVVNASSITNFFPYPNPFTTHTQFVFTLTGETIPDDIKIQIMSISGKVVREISKAELGSIKIGHNISDYKWNGCDEYGDRLANGVYLYRVLIKNASTFEKRSTSADGYFKGGFGKLYLMK